VEGLQRRSLGLGASCDSAECLPTHALAMAVKTTRQRREPATLATLGPDDPEALLGVAE
jgi:hypothetical protein